MRYLILFALSLFPKAAFAGAPTAPTSFIPLSGIVGTSCNFVVGNIGFDCIPYYIGYVIELFLTFAGAFFMFGIMIAGYKYILGSLTGQGKDAANKEVIARIIGFVVIVFSYLIVDTIIHALTM